MTPNQKLLCCFIANLSNLVLVASIVFALAEDATPFWRVGPGPNFTIISVKINTMARYIGLILIIILIELTQTATETATAPIFQFTIFNPDRREIADFSRFELFFFSNGMSTANSFRGIFMTMAAISQVDVAVVAVIASRIAMAYIINSNLREKTFPGFAKLDEGDAVELNAAEIAV